MCEQYNTSIFMDMRSGIKDAEITTVDADGCKMPERRTARSVHRHRHDRGNTPRVCARRGGPEPRLNARPDGSCVGYSMAEVESRVADGESQRLRDIWCVSSSIPSSTTLLGPRVPRYSLPSLFPISFFGSIGYDAPRTFQPMHIRGSSDWQQTRRIQSFDRFRDRISPVVLYKYINRKCTTILVAR